MTDRRRTDRVIEKFKYVTRKISAWHWCSHITWSRDVERLVLMLVASLFTSSREVKCLVIVLVTSVFICTREMECLVMVLGHLSL